MPAAQSGVLAPFQFTSASDAVITTTATTTRRCGCEPIVQINRGTHDETLGGDPMARHVSIEERLDAIGRGENLDLADIVCADAKNEIKRLRAALKSRSESNQRQNRSTGQKVPAGRGCE
jgi:hypothetical protein